MRRHAPIPSDPLYSHRLYVCPSFPKGRRAAILSCALPSGRDRWTDDGYRVHRTARDRHLPLHHHDQNPDNPLPNVQ
eukprot:scaffold216485_cov83-Attheya_sp.AAC.1